MAVLQELEQAIGQVAAGASGSLVGIGRGPGRGSGVVVAEGQVVTNAHNLRGEEATVVFADGRSATGRVAGVDLDGDLAVLAVDTAGAPAITWADADGVQVGTPVFALASPGGRTRVTFGTVSAVDRAFRGPRGRRITGSIEHTAPLARGSSGGPLVDAESRLVGLNTNRLGDGFYLALPADAELRARVEALGRGESPSRPRLGLGLAPARVARHLRRAVGLPDREGLLVRVVEDGSPADRAGVRTGDLLVRAGERDLASTDDLYQALDSAAAGGMLVLGLVRGAEELTVEVHFADAGPTDVGSA